LRPLHESAGVFRLVRSGRCPSMSKLAAFRHRDGASESAESLSAVIGSSIARGTQAFCRAAWGPRRQKATRGAIGASSGASASLSGRATKRVPHTLRHNGVVLLQRMDESASREKTESLLGHSPGSVRLNYDPIH
jgi:hypothetical protein